MGKLATLCKDIIGKPSNLWRIRNFDKNIEEIASLDIELTGKCNLRCKGCTHFSPIAEEGELDTDTLLKDLVQLHKVMGSKIRKISLLGGEPLLHSKIIQCMEITNECFPEAEKAVVTNGILLLGEPDEFWKAVKKENFQIEVTKYPVQLDFGAMVKKAKDFDVAFSFFGRSGYVQKTLYYLPLDLDGGCNPMRSFRQCFMARSCFTLRDGKLYPCSYAAFIGRFNAAFNKDIPVTEKDCSDIYNESCEEILAKMSGPIPMCAYCDVERRTYGNEWETSKYDMKEWS